MGLLDDAIREHLELKRRHGADNAEVSRQEREVLGGGEASNPAEPQATYEESPSEMLASIADDVVAPPVPPVPEPLAGSALAGGEPPAPRAAPAPDLFPGTNELVAAANETARPEPTPRPEPAAAPAPPGSLADPAPSGADSETAARSGARRLSDEELAAWRRRLSERADRLAAQRPGAPAVPPATPPTAAATSAGAAATPEPPSYWSGNTSSSDVGAPPSVPPGPQTPAGAAPDPGVPVDFFDAADAASAFGPEAAPEPETPDGDVLDETPDFLEETPEHDRMWFEQRPPRDFDFG